MPSVPAFDWRSLIAPIHQEISGSRGADTLAAEAEGDAVLGLAGDDQLGSTFSRTALVGGRGNDTLATNLAGTPGVFSQLAVQVGGEGADSLDARVAWDFFDTAQREADVFIDGGRGADTIQVDILAAIVGGSVLGGDGNDSITATASGHNFIGNADVMNTIDGGDGNDRVVANASGANG